MTVSSEKERGGMGDEKGTSIPLGWQLQEELLGQVWLLVDDLSTLLCYPERTSVSKS